MSRKYKRPEDESEGKNPAALSWDVPNFGYPRTELSEEPTTGAEDEQLSMATTVENGDRATNQESNSGNLQTMQGKDKAARKDFSNVSEEGRLTQS